MKTNCGKGYFYAMGQRDRHLYGDGMMHYLLRINGSEWPIWAAIAYKSGYIGVGL